jgi:predicted nuclease with TOPRIM domain
MGSQVDELRFTNEISTRDRIVDSATFNNEGVRLHLLKDSLSEQLEHIQKEHTTLQQQNFRLIQEVQQRDLRIGELNVLVEQLERDLSASKGLVARLQVRWRTRMARRSCVNGKGPSFY